MLHSERDGWSFTALYSNTARAHELGRTRDWVVIYFEHDGHEDQCTVVTEYSGPLAGKRVVRGREGESGRPADSNRCVCHHPVLTLAMPCHAAPCPALPGLALQ